MRTFANTRDAKEFLVSRIIMESQREGVPLSEVERKMLYFSETAWTLPDMAEVSDAFDREYDQAEFEQETESSSVTSAPTPALVTKKNLRPGTRHCAPSARKITTCLFSSPRQNSRVRPQGDS
jgi:hypothetical protein